MAEQSCATAVTEDELKRRTGEFDLEVATFLDLSDLGLAELGSVPLCLSLRVLNLSCNQLASVGALGALSALEELDLSANLVTNLEGFEKLEKLQRLDLPGNNVSQLEAVLPLCGLPDLRSLCLQLLGTSLTNPVCLRREEYAAFMSLSFPILSWLDGERVEGEEVREKGCVAAVDSGEGEGSEQRELERRLERLAAVGREPVGEEVKSKKLLEGADLTAHFTLNDHQAMGKITRLLSESSHTSQRVQEHIETLRRELLH